MLGCLAASCALYLVSLIQPYLNSVLSSCFLLTFTFFYDAFTLAASWLFSKFNATLPNHSSFFLFFSHLLFTMMIPCRHRGRKNRVPDPRLERLTIAMQKGIPKWLSHLQPFSIAGSTYSCLWKA